MFFGKFSARILAGISLVIAIPAWPAAFYQVNHDTETAITEFGSCFVVTNRNPSGLAIFVPTNTFQEWETFYRNLPTGVTAAWGPKCLGNMTLWLDSSDTEYLFTNTACTTNVSANGQTVRCWKDRNGTNNFTQGTAGSAPIYSTAGGPNSNSVLTFAAKYMDSASVNLNPRSVFIVYRDTSTASWATPFTSANSVVGNGWWHANDNDTSVFHATWTLADMRSGTHYTNGNSWTYAGAPGALDDRPDSWTLLNVNPTTNYANASGVWTLGRDRTFAGREISGGIAELVVFNTTLSTADREITEGYLACKWGIQAGLPASHPYKSSCPFDASGCSGTMVGGFCWYYGNAGESCTTVCGTHGGYHTATLDFAGSNGSDANCISIMDAMGLAGTTVTNNAGAHGCATRLGARRRYSTATTAAASNGNVRRICACNN